ncbi:MAG: transposase [Eubacteriales bacterium]|nr:transposase [Eubacteriales bacterium]
MMVSRPPRILSETGLYHIVFRGINRQNLFEEEQDYKKMLEILRDIKSAYEIEIYAYCLMTNHVHLFVKEKEIGDIKIIMHKILTRYVMWYNRKYQRSGSLIGNRYKSEPIEDEAYYLTLMRYIHQNPLKAGMVNDVEEYIWSSYNDYINMKNELTDIDFGLSIFSNDEEKALKAFDEYHKEMDDYDFSISNTKRLTDEQLKRRIIMVTDGISPEKISLRTKIERDAILAILRNEGFTIGQLERVTGISRGIITRANVQK